MKYTIFTYAYITILVVCGDNTFFSIISLYNHVHMYSFEAMMTLYQPLYVVGSVLPSLAG